MIAAMAQWEREEIAERIAASVPVRAKMGKRLGGAAPFGYRWEGQELVPDATEAPVRKLVHELFLEERRLKTVARLLNERGYRTRKGAKFTDTTIERLLRDPTAKGERRANYTRSQGRGKAWALKPEEEWVVSSVQAVVSGDVWDQAIAILDDRRAKSEKPARRAVHLFTGLVRCECGQKMYVPWKVPKYVCYECRNKIGVADLEAVFQEQLKGFLLSPEDVANYLGQADDEIRSREERLSSLEDDLGRVRADMEKFHRLYLADQISMDGFGRQYRPLEEREKALQEEVPRLQGELDFLRIQAMAKDDILAGAKDLSARWPALSSQEKRQIVEAVVEAVRVGKEDVEIDLGYFPSSAEIATQRQRNLEDAWPPACCRSSASQRPISLFRPPPASRSR